MRDIGVAICRLKVAEGMGAFVHFRDWPELAGSADEEGVNRRVRRDLAYRSGFEVGGRKVPCTDENISEECGVLHEGVVRRLMLEDDFQVFQYQLVQADFDIIRTRKM